VYDRDGTRSLFRSKTAALVKGALEFLHRVTLGTTKNSANRALMTFTFPIEGTVDGVIVVTSTSTATVDFNFAPGLTEEQRKTFYGWVVNTLSHADVKAQNIAVSPLS
jgi:hypothetical protein